MNGVVDEFGRALVTLKIRHGDNEPPTEITAWIDTAFNGELVMPRPMIEAERLEQSAGVGARLADGRVVMLESFAGVLDWFGEERPIEIIANDGEYSLLGIGLLTGRRLTVDYTQLSVTIE